MLKTAKIITEEYEGIFPNNTEELIKLPGVGPYTVAAIQAFAYDEKVLSFDTNLEKILSRYFHGTRFQKLTKEEKIQIEKDFRATGISGRDINAAFMDFGSLVSSNNKPIGQEDWDNILKNYPLSGCKWVETRGVLEIQEKKKKLIFPTKDASIRVILHENHHIYYSSRDEGYEPFCLAPSEDDIRHTVQEYFRTKYHLEVSVRPVHDKYFEDDKPYMNCNAQIQKGNPLFKKYRKEN
jgi:adenine-specific DNA glycosylase